ncbi:MAG TPA: PspC domain-containing protein [Nocardioidaceae bacterium]|nr:PspC domain-containing protein [Nocardioidaceae bacterium]
MTQTPPDASGSGMQHDGPRVSGDQARDLGRLRRSTTDRKVAGVAGGLGRHLDVDPTLLRVAFVVLIFFGGAGLLLYGAAWLLVPEDGQSEGVVGSSAGTRTAVLVSAGVVAALLALGDSWGGFGFPWPLLVVGAIVVVFLLNRDRRAAPPAVGQQPPTGQHPAMGPQPSPGWPVPAPPPPAAPHRGPRLFWPTAALATLALGVLGIYDVAGNTVVDAAYPALALAVVGLMLVLGAWVGRTGGLIFLGAVAAVALVVSSLVSDFSVGRFERAPSSAAALPASYSMAAGRMDVDLSDIDDVAALDGRELDITATAGEVIVTLPDGVDADVRVEVDGSGEVEIGDDRRAGDDLVMQRQIDGGTAAPELDLDIDLLFGRVEVRT